METLNYGEREPIKPWLGIYENGKLHRFNDETDEIDLDTNATARVGEETLFYTYLQALEYYRKESFLCAEHFIEKASHYYTESHRAASEIAHDRRSAEELKKYKDNYGSCE